MSTSNGTARISDLLSEDAPQCPSPVAKKPRKAVQASPVDPASKSKSKLPSTAQMRLWITLTMGVFIPLFSLGLSHAGGVLLQGKSYSCLYLGVFSLGLMGCVLAVSLSHLAWSIENITRGAKWASWLLAVSFDLALVLGELTHVGASEAGIGGVVTVIMGAVCLLSMVLNCWAFLKHPGAIHRALRVAAIEE